MRPTYLQRLERLRQITAAISVTLVASGCASAPRNDMVVRVPTPRGVDAVQVRVTDVRKPTDRESRPDLAIRQFVFLGDNALDPGPVSLVKQYVARNANALRSPTDLELVRFDVGLSTSEVRDIYRTGPPLAIMPGAPAGAIVLGNLVGQLLVAAFQGGDVNQSVVVNLEVRVANETVTVSDFGFLYSGRSISSAVEAVLPRALESLANKVAEAQTRASTSPKIEPIVITTLPNLAVNADLSRRRFACAGSAVT